MSVITGRLDNKYRYTDLTWENECFYSHARTHLLTYSINTLVYGQYKCTPTVPLLLYLANFV